MCTHPARILVWTLSGNVYLFWKIQFLIAMPLFQVTALSYAAETSLLFVNARGEQFPARNILVSHWSIWNDFKRANVFRHIEELRWISTTYHELSKASAVCNNAQYQSHTTAHNIKLTQQRTISNSHNNAQYQYHTHSLLHILRFSNQRYLVFQRNVDLRRSPVLLPPSIPCVWVIDLQQ